MTSVSDTILWAKNLSLEEIPNLSEEIMLTYIMERPGHPGSYGFMLPPNEFDSQEQFAQIFHALMQRMSEIPDLKEKMNSLLNLENQVDSYEESDEIRLPRHLANQAKKSQKIVYIDMDNVLVDFKSGIARLSKETVEKYGDDLDDVPGIFAMMDALPGAIDAFHRISKKYDTYILSTAPWENPLALSDKVVWVKRHLGDVAKKRLIISHHKNLNKGDYLIDDRTRNGASEFEGEHIHFGTEKFPDWESVLQYLNA